MEAILSSIFGDHYILWSIVIVSILLWILIIIRRHIIYRRIYEVSVNGVKKRLIIKTWGNLEFTKTSTNLGTTEDLLALYRAYPKIRKRCPIVATHNWARLGNFTFLCKSGRLETYFLSLEIKKNKFRYLMLLE